MTSYELPKVGSLVRVLGFSGTWKILSVHGTGRVFLVEVLTGARRAVDVSQVRA